MKIVTATLWMTVPLNLAAGVALSFPASPLGQLIDLPHQSYSFHTLLSGSLVALFGVVYAWLALQPAVNRGLLFFGACGKTMAVGIAAISYATGQLSGVTMVVMCGDLIFAAVWFAWLFTT